VIAATNRDLHAEVAAGRFRQDLYFRLSVFPIEIVPLRERVEDIPLLAQQFLERLSKRMHLPVTRISSQSLEQLRAYPWPGNVRELQNVIERAVISSRDGRLSFETLLPPSARPARSATSRRHPRAPAAGRVVTRRELRQLEAENLQAALEESNWKIYGPRGAAELLGMRPTTLASRLRTLGIKKPR